MVDKKIRGELVKLSQEECFRVLFASESGSRAWGFASPDSDYDVRFIYAHPLRWYLRVRSAADTCERMSPGDLDLSGWEIRKTLRHFGDGNPTLYEWFGSPQVYLDGSLSTRLKTLMPQFFNPRRGMYHYASMARRSASDQQPRRIKLKRLFYTIRALCACQWIETHKTMPPTPFADLLAGCRLTDEVSEEVHRQWDIKRKATEDEWVAFPSGLSDWIDQGLEHFQAIAAHMPIAEARPFDQLDEILFETVTCSSNA